MTQLAYANPEFYRHSGRVNAARLLPAWLALAATAAVIGSAYAVTCVYINIAVMLSAFIFMFTCLGVGFAATKIVAWARVRNLPLAICVGLSAGITALFFAWLIWLRLQLPRFQVDITLAYLLTHPAFAVHCISEINRIGVWTIGHSNDPVSGIPLWIVWITESGGILFTPVVLAFRFVRDTPYCEHCDAWGTSRVLAHVKRADVATIRQHMLSRNFAYLQTLGPSNQSDQWIRITLEGCTQCESVPLLTVHSGTITIDRKGNRKTKTRIILRHLMLSPDDSTSLILTCAALANPQDATPVPPTPPA